MDSLRLILILAGAVIIVAVYLYSRYRKGSPQELRGSGFQTAQSNFNSTSAISASQSTDRNGRTVIIDPSIYSCDQGDSEAEDSAYSEPDSELSELGRNIKIEENHTLENSTFDKNVPENNSVHDTSIQAEADPDSSIESQRPAQQDEDGLVEKVMVIYLLAQPGQEFVGSEIVSVADAEGLQFGNDGYFHRYANPNDNAESIFGIANILEPGLFDLSAGDNFHTPGLVFFQRLSNAGGALKAFDSMLETVISCRDRLDGRLQDSGRRPLNKSAMIKLREQVAEFSLTNPVTPF